MERLLNRVHVLLLLALVGLLSLWPLPRADAQSRQVDRSYFGGRWVEIARVSLDLLNPSLLTVQPTGPVAFDYGDMTLKAFDWNGQPRWSFGRVGSGPGEFRNPTDMKTGANDGLLVLDPAVSRVTFVTSSGTLEHTSGVAIPLDKLAAGSGGTAFLGAPRSPVDLLIAFDRTGQPLQPIPLLPELSPVPFIPREPILASRGDGTSVMGFYWSSSLFLIGKSGRILKTVSGIGSAEFPKLKSTKTGNATVTRVDPERRQVTRSIAIDDTIAYVLRTVRDQGRVVVDHYSLPNLDYLGSSHLPWYTTALGAGSGRLSGIIREPEPIIVIWVWQDH